MSEFKEGQEVEIVGPSVTNVSFSRGTKGRIEQPSMTQPGEWVVRVNGAVLWSFPASSLCPVPAPLPKLKAGDRVRWTRAIPNSAVFHNCQSVEETKVKHVYTQPGQPTVVILEGGELVLADTLEVLPEPKREPQAGEVWLEGVGKTPYFCTRTFDKVLLHHIESGNVWCDTQALGKYSWEKWEYGFPTLTAYFASRK